ncbi:hypothetical protein G3M48_006564 [Beauveria asiatica]|uniref:F-box domain-containing protein n=1 Tax=Beauveria asiatica TaxID=1069075 RepID=A0AAW0RNY6_9HYPO
MPNSLWSLARARLTQAYNNKTTTESLPLHLGSQPPSYEDSIQDRVETDVLLNRIFYNQLNSPLARLPDHILVNIMRSSDLESLFRLRHTSRIFMILFSVNPAFKSLHLTSDDHQRFYDTARLWEDIGFWHHMFTGTVNDEMRAFDPNVCDCVDYYQDRPSLQRQRPLRICPAPAVARWQETAPEGGYVSETGRCAYMRHGFTLDAVGIQLRVDFLKCHDVTKEMLAMRKTLDCAIDPHAASSPGWGDLVSWLSNDTVTDKKKQGLVFCRRKDCDTWRLQNFDVHLRAIEAKQIQRGKLVSTTTTMAKERQDGGDEDDISGAIMMAMQ